MPAVGNLRCIMEYGCSSVVGASQQKRQQQQQHILESRRTSHIRGTRYFSEVPVLHTPVEVKFSMTCRSVVGRGKRGNVHIPAIMLVAFPDVVVFDGFI